MATPAAHAYCLQTIQGLDGYHRWKQEVPYFVSTSMKDAKILAAIDAAFATWQAVSCSSIKFKKGGTFALGSEVFDQHGKYGIYLFWHTAKDGFPAADNFISYTAYTLDADGGIVSSSMAINGFKYTWATDGNGGAIDAQGELTRLIGQVIGIGPSNASASVMKNSVQYGDTSKRTLQQDDIEALTYLYAEAGCPAAPEPGTDGCSTPTGGTPTGGDAGGPAPGGDDAGSGPGPNADAGVPASGSDLGSTGTGTPGPQLNTGCSSSADCGVGQVCTSDGTCVALGTAETAGDGCAVGSDAGTPLGTLLVIGLGLIALVRRQQR